MLPKWFTPITVALIAGLSIWLLSSQSPKQPQLGTSNKSVPDYFVENFTIHNFDENGKTHHEISAKYMAHFPIDDSSKFTSLEFIFYQSGIKSWAINASNGTTSKDIKEVKLGGEVNIHRFSNSEYKSGLEINTSELLIRPDESYLETDQAISITDGKHNLKAVGIRANFDAGKFELLSRVRGVYAL